MGMFKNLLRLIGLAVAGFELRGCMASGSKSLRGASKGVTAAPRYSNKPRVRREWRTLDEETKLKVARAFWTLKNLTTPEGQQIYGKNFRNHDDMLMLHACSTMDPRCDQGHFGPHFMTFHRLLLLKYEMALLSVDPSIGAMPYWNMAYDSVGGKYRHDPEKYFFSDNYIGSYYGTGPNHAVVDGLFAYWPIAHWTRDRFGSTSVLAQPWNTCITEEWFVPERSSNCSRCCMDTTGSCSCDGSDYPRFLRNHDDCTPHVVRYPKDPDGQINVGPEGMGGTFEIIYDEADFAHCMDPNRTRTWMEWQNCIELSTASCLLPGSSEHTLLSQVLPSLVHRMAGSANRTEKERAKDQLARLVNALAQTIENCTDTMLLGIYEEASSGRLPTRGYANFFHSQAHIKFGKDFLDVTTSPNEAAAFTGYHADIDRSNMMWMSNAAALEEQHWTYPREQTTNYSGPKPYGTSGPYGIYDFGTCRNSSTYSEYHPGSSPWLPGTLYDDVANSGFPFFDLFGCEGSSGESPCDGLPNGYTHGDVLFYTAPERTPYTYDTLEDLYYS